MARIAAHDARTVFGSNVKFLGEVSGLDPWETGRVVMKRAINTKEIRNVPAEDSWRIFTKSWRGSTWHTIMTRRSNMMKLLH